MRATVFGLVGLFNTPAELAHDQLLAVANAQDRNPEIKDCDVDVGRTLIVHARRPAAKHNARRTPCLNVSARHSGRKDLAVDALFANAPRNQLRELRTKIQDQDAIASVLDFFAASLGSGGGLRHVRVNRSDS